MDIKFFDSIDSTSLEAMRILSGDVREPFAVIAEKQSGGKGRRGKSWVSKPGNIYLTVGFPFKPSTQPKPEQLENTPLIAALAVARFLEEMKIPNPVIKWPNDILIGGRKICGILCESSVSGSSIQGITVGVGLNLIKVIDPSFDYPVTSVEEEIGQPLNAKEIAPKLCRFIESEFQKEFSIANYRSYLPLGGLVCAQSSEKIKDRKVRLFKGVNDQGNLLVQKLNHEDLTEEFSSVTSSFGLITQKNSSLPLVLADVGNTSAKFEVSVNNEIVASYGVSYDLGELDLDILDDIKETVFEHIPLGVARWPVYFGSVNAEGYRKVSEKILDRGLYFSEIPKSPFRVKLEQYPLAQLGFDRLALMEGFLSQEKLKNIDLADQIACLVSFGTATTIDFLGGDGRYFGGLILPGVNLSAKALNEHTSQLPVITFDSYLEDSIKSLKLGSNTETSMTTGVLATQFGAIKESIRSLKKQFDHEITVKDFVVSGGAWSAVKPFFEDSFAETEGLNILTSINQITGYREILSASRLKDA